MSDKTTIVNLADEHQGHQNQYRLYFLRLLSKVKICLVFNNMHQILPIAIQHSSRILGAERPT